MSFRFRKSVKIAPGVRINVGKKSSSISVGGHGAHVTFGSGGKKTSTIGIPGTGISYSSSSSNSSHGKASSQHTGSTIAIILVAFIIIISLSYLLTSSLFHRESGNTDGQISGQENLQPDPTVLDDAARSQLEEILTQQFAGATVSISDRADSVVTSITIPGLADILSKSTNGDSDAHANWDDNIAQLEVAGESIADILAEDALKKNAVLYVLSDLDNETILVTVAGGKTLYDAATAIEADTE